MDRPTQESLTPARDDDTWSPARRQLTRRQALRYGVGGAAGLGALDALAYFWLRPPPGERGGARPSGAAPGAGDGAARGGPLDRSPDVFVGGAPSDEVWELWNRRGWVRKARHFATFGTTVRCNVCPNECRLAPGDRGRCRNRVNRGGTLYTLVYGNPCCFNADPIEKKPLYHFLPGTRVYSIATSGCGFRCLNCQNWDISQRKPEETKDPRGRDLRIDKDRIGRLSRRELMRLMAWQRDRLSLFPEDVVAVAKRFDCPSIAYTYSEPTSYFEYMYETARLAHAVGIRNVWVTCGYISREALEDLSRFLDAANVDLKSFDDRIYKTLNTGKLQPILDTLKTLKDRGVWFEVTNLIVPTYTDKLDMIARMCDWLLDNIGPDYPLHFSRFHPQHKLSHLPPTPVDVLLKARQIARKSGLRYVYIGNVRVPDGGTTFCPKCGKPIVRRDVYMVRAQDVKSGRCAHCGTPIAGVWKA